MIDINMRGIKGFWGSLDMELLKPGFRDNHPKTLGFRDSDIHGIWDLVILTTGFWDLTFQFWDFKS